VTCIGRSLPSCCDNFEIARIPRSFNTLLEPAAVDVFVSGTEGYPCYRIPAVIRLPSGTILLFAEGRRGGDTGPNDIVYKASTDSGASWSALKVLHSEWEPPGHGWHTVRKNATTWNTTHVRAFFGRLWPFLHLGAGADCTTRHLR
jgi:sialidase-1